MKQFKVLDRDLNLHQHYLLEASAGTGKTYSIQNIVVRLLIEPHGEIEPLSLQKILVVTFTKAATRDLKIRIRTNIEQALNELQNYLINEDLSEEVPDYLKACIEKGEDFVKQSCKRLQQALFTFDQSQIFTIHSFCARMLRQFALESDMGLHAFTGEEPLPRSEILSIIRDFFRTEVRLENYSPAQLEILLKHDPEHKELLKLIQSAYHFPTYASFREMSTELSNKMLSLKQHFNLTSTKMIKDFQTQCGAYRNHKSAESKADTLEKITRFAQLFDQESWSFEEIDELVTVGMIWVKALDPVLAKGKLPAPEELHFPELTKRLQQDLAPLIDESGDPAVLLARLANDCRKLFNRFQQEEEKLSPDDILRKMAQSLEESIFLCKVQSQYQAAIIDEFQDTDPLQWKIFKNLFISEQFPWSGYLYLVGDPKQSIYSFRQADIYTYLAAAQALGDNHCYSLDVNYRSEPRLVEALNTLFASDYLPYFIPLPKMLDCLRYQAVQAGRPHLNQDLEHERGAVHFFIADAQGKKAKINDLESEVFFPYMVQEIIRLRKQHHLEYRQFAILVRDRHQGLRLAEFFDHVGIPYLNQKGKSLTDSPAHQALIDLIRALLHPQDRGVLRNLLGSPLLGWSYAEVKNSDALEFVLLFVQRLRSSLLENGFAVFFQEMLQSICNMRNQTVVAQIIEKEGGIEFFRDLQQLADLVIDHQYLEWSGFEGLIPFLDQLKTWEDNDDGRMKRFQDPTANGVKILTLHYSKGLEFDVVFALGLVNRTSIKEDLIPTESNGRQWLIPFSEDSPAYQRYCEECDAEKMRQLYVALTRAKSHLYIPMALHLPSEKIKWGEASPLDLFLARLGQASFESYTELYARIKNQEVQSYFDFMDKVGQKHHITYSIHQKIGENLAIEKVMSSPNQLHAPLKVVVANHPLWMTSFSSLSQYLEHKATERLPYLAGVPRDYESEIKNIHTLPANRETGLFIHQILEKLIFGEFKNLKSPEDVLVFIRPFVHKTIFKEWEKVIACLIFNTLTTLLPNPLGDFCLADLKSDQLYREMPFVFPYNSNEKIEELVMKEGLIKGVIDCLFNYHGKYYLLDWKTNWLGTHAEAYQTNSLHSAMQEHAYFLQATIYTEAIKRYLVLVDKRSFEDCFGGVYYLFIRGMQLGHPTGIYHFIPTQIIKRV